MDAEWMWRLRKAAQALGLPDEEILSGAGHDAAVFAKESQAPWYSCANENGSHYAKEAMNLDDFATGIAVMRGEIEEAAK